MVGVVFYGKVSNYRRNTVPYEYMNKKVTGMALSYSTGPSGVATVLLYVEDEE